MKHQEHNPQEAIKQAIAAVRAEQPDQATIEAAGDRVWQSLNQSVSATSAEKALHGCAGVRTLLVQYRNNELTEGRKLLVAAHLNECVQCRAEAEKSGSRKPAVQPWKHELPPATGNGFRWAAAAAAAFVLAASGYFFTGWFFAGPAGMRARVESFDGAIFRVGTSGEQPLKSGDEIEEGQERVPGGGTPVGGEWGDAVE